jgi:hypothetical protein
MTNRLTALAAMTLLFSAAAPVAHAQDRHRGESVECKSHDRGRTRCAVDWSDARLVDQLSDTECVRGQNWGIDRRGIWVNRGCSARFVEAGRHGHERDRADRGDGYRGDENGWNPGPDWNSRFNVACESRDYQYHFCAVDLGGAGRASVARQISKTDCVEGRNFGSNRAGVWVNEGCAAEFSIDRRWR